MSGAFCKGKTAQLRDDVPLFSVWSVDSPVDGVAWFPFFFLRFKVVLLKLYLVISELKLVFFMVLCWFLV